MPQLASLVLGALALVMATAMLATQATLSLYIVEDSLARAASVVSAILEGILLIDFIYLSTPLFVPSVKVQSRWSLGIAFSLGVLVCTIATATSVIALAYSRKMAAKQQTPFGIVVACAVICVLSFLGHISFLIVYFLTARTEVVSAASWSLHKDEKSGLRPRNLKAIRYSQTLPIMTPSQRNTLDMESLASPKSISGRSTFDGARLSVASTSPATRPASSGSRLVPFKEFERGASIESNTNRSSGGDAFDSWDTSTVDVHNRQVVLEMSSPTQAKGRGLETIPASPVPSRSPSPESFSDLEPPPLRTRTRSYSPVSIDRERLPRPTTPGANSEAHIHPLFRSDSPDPHPLATPGTSVMASPDAGRVIVHRASNRSLNRMRSGSLPIVRSPLSKQGAFEGSDRSAGQLQLCEPDALASHEPAPERVVTPPIPEWILSAGFESR